MEIIQVFNRYRKKFEPIEIDKELRYGTYFLTQKVVTKLPEVWAGYGI